MNFQKSRCVIHPNNAPSSSSYSALNYPAVSFVIGKQAAFLDPKTIRLNGKFRLANQGGDLIKNNVALTGVSPGTASSGRAVPNSVGISSIIDEILISTLNGRAIETIRSYNRYLASTKPLMTSSLEYNNGCGLADPHCADKSLISAKAACVETDFSVPIECGLFSPENDQLLNISQKGFWGLNVDLLLATNDAVVGPYLAYLGNNGVLGTDKIAAIAGDSYSYSVSDLTLSYDLIRPSADVWNRIPSSGVLQFSTISSLHSTLLSSDQTTNLRFGCRNLVSVTHSIIPSVWVNNRRVDSLQPTPPLLNVTADGDSTDAKVKNVSYLRAGVLYPYNYLLDVEAQAGFNSTPHAPQAQIMKPYLNSVSLFDNRHNKFNPQTNVGINSKHAEAGSGAQNLNSGPDPRSSWGLGTCMDSNRQGINFSDKEYALRVQSDLNDSSILSLYSFARCRNVAEYSPAGVQVIE